MSRGFGLDEMSELKPLLFVIKPSYCSFFLSLRPDSVAILQTDYFKRNNNNHTPKNEKKHFDY